MTRLLSILFGAIVLIGNTSFCPIEVTQHLGFNLVPNWSGDLVTFAEVKVHKGHVIDFISITPREFALLASGNMRSQSNPDTLNYFEEYQIPSCKVTYLDDFDRHAINCPILDNLWKLRFRKRPGDPSSGTTTESGNINAGWARGPNGANAPSQGQRNMLKQFGLTHLSDFAWGDDCFKLIKATTDGGWVSSYQAQQ